MNETEAVAKAPAHPQTLGRTAWLALTVLSSLNLLNYADRYVISSLLPTLQKPVEEGGLALTDGEDRLDQGLTGDDARGNGDREAVGRRLVEP